MDKLSKAIIRAILIFVWSFTLAAENSSSTLNHNPFSKPDLLIYKPPVNVQKKSEQNENFVPEFILSATLISVNGPMAVVNNKLLLIGEEVDGIKLLVVDEARAVIRFKGKTYDITITNPQSEIPEEINKL